MDREEMTPQQSQAIAHLMEAPSVAEAARRAGVARATIYNWLKKPHFRGELDNARRAEDQARLNRLRSMVEPALEALEGLLASEDERIRLRDAAEVLRAYQRLAAEPAAMPALELPGEEWTEATLPLLAKRCMEGLLSGTLDARAAHMAPQYLAFLERSFEKEAERKRREEWNRMDPAERVALLAETLKGAALPKSVLPKPASGGPDDKPP